VNTFQQKSNTWEPPIELQRSTPREVTLTGAGRAASVGAVLLVVGAVVMFALMYGTASADAERWAAWQAEAVAAEGRVTEARRVGSGDNRKMALTYQYAANGSVYEGRARLNYKRWRNVSAGMTIGVSYRRSEPSVNWITGATEPKGIPILAAILAPLSLLIPVPIIVFQIRRQRRLLEEGRAARATVTAAKKVSSQHGSHYRIAYEFETLSGARRSGKYQANRKPPEVGEPLIVVYHPDEEKWSARYPLSLVRVVGSE